MGTWNDIVLSHFCLQHYDGRIRVWRHRGEKLLNCSVMHRHTGPAPGIMAWGGIGFHCHTCLVRIAGTLNRQRYISEVLEPVVLPYIQRLLSDIFQQDNAQPHGAHNFQESSSLPFRLNCFLGLLVLPILRQSRTCVPYLLNDWPRIHYSLLHQINFGNM
ncbi:transposable element Tcb1 transposase [Trichonephila clavipes]|nr:transposable element Tcb1 transposase [Trichonephila clavipes]